MSMLVTRRLLLLAFLLMALLLMGPAQVGSAPGSDPPNPPGPGGPNLAIAYGQLIAVSTSSGGGPPPTIGSIGIHPSINPNPPGSSFPVNTSVTDTYNVTPATTIRTDTGTVITLAQLPPYICAFVEVIYNPANMRAVAINIL